MATTKVTIFITLHIQVYSKNVVANFRWHTFKEREIIDFNVVLTAVSSKLYGASLNSLMGQNRNATI